METKTKSDIHNERRHFWRAAFHSPVKITTQEEASLAQLIDISLQGALLKVAAEWHGKMHDSCSLRLELSPDDAISMSSTITHIDGRHVGVKCDSIDLDSITHLRRLVELNSGDPAILDRDLASLLHGG